MKTEANSTQGGLGTTQIKLKIRPEVREAIDKVANQRGWSLMDVMREAICVYVGIPNELSPRTGFQSGGGNGRPLRRPTGRAG